MSTLTSSDEWRALAAHHADIARTPMREMFQRDPDRFSKFSIAWKSFFLDYSKNRITEETLSLLFALARKARVEEWRDRMFAGEKINSTEQRAVLHTALRNRSGRPV